MGTGVARAQRELLAHLDKYKRYPANRSQASAAVLIALTLDRSGRVLTANVAKSSGDAAFDDAALRMGWYRVSDP
jgi:outer membrane biosynthesis protein TonB